MSAPDAPDTPGAPDTPDTPNTPDTPDTPGAPGASDAGPEPAGDHGAVFAALGDPTRRQLLDRLAREGPLSATQLAPDYPISRQALVKHLASLSAAGLVDAARSGREVRYEVVTARIEEAVGWLEDVGRRWDQRLDALRLHLESPDLPKG